MIPSLAEFGFVWDANDISYRHHLSGCTVGNFTVL